MNYQEFAGKIRQKYPGSYDDMDDQTLARKIVDKFPQYSDVTFDQGAPTAPSAPPAMSTSGFGQAVDMVKKSPLFNSLMPTNLLQSAPEAMRNLGAKAGDFVSENLAKPLMRKNSFTDQMYNANPIPPQAAAAAGFATRLAPDIAMTVSAPGALEGQFEGPQFIGRWGARQVNNAAGIAPNTIVKMAGQNNPAKVGESIGRQLVKEGAFGAEAGQTFEQAHNVMNKFGGDVESALSAIKNAGQPVTVDFSEATTPLVNKIQELQTSAYQNDRALAKPVLEAYRNLANVAKSNDGQVGLDHVRALMQETGSAMERLGPTNPRREIFSEIYATLADARDNIVSQIAERAGNPQLRQNLLKANEGYSRYVRLMPDIRKAAARSAVGQSNNPLESNMFSRAFDVARPFLAKAAVKIGGTPAPATAGSMLTPAVAASPEEIANARNPRAPIPLQMIIPARPKARPLFRKAS